MNMIVLIMYIMITNWFYNSSQLANDANLATGIDPNSFKAVIDDQGNLNFVNWKTACTSKYTLNIHTM